MTTLYRPMKITSAEQAEALPEGTIATHDEHWPVERCTPNRWESSARDMKHAEMIGWTALVPIEAEEVRVIASGDLERDYHGATVFNHTPDGPRRDYRRTEFHTPWEEA